jgi:LysR family glycine cleavage system transcriptional activator
LHFARAAAELNLTPTAISHQVRQLEESLGIELFRRYPRPVQLSSAGEKLYPVLRDTLDRIAGAIGELVAESPHEPLRLTVTMAFASKWLMPRLPQLRQQTGLAIVVEADDLVVDLHASGVDMAIRYAERPSSNGEWHRLFPDHIVPVCAPSLLSDERPLSPDKILTLPLLHYRWKSGAASAPSWERWAAQAQAEQVHPPITQTFSEESHAIDAALAGQGVVLASEHFVRGQIAAGSLTQLSQIALPSLIYWAVFLPTHPAKTQLNCLLGWLREQA